ncbi:MAG: hypothetical protein JNJ83_04830 [Verrucomicrobiaceae bacterium]|nr:hypothetical protein [Verrucomicrobiaceae bacterium]
MKLLSGVILFTALFTPLAQAESSDRLTTLVKEVEALENESAAWPHFVLSKSDEEGGYVQERHTWQHPEHRLTAKTRVFDYDDHGELTIETVMKEGKLLYVLKRRTNTPFTENAKTSVTEERFYFDNKKLIGAFAKSASLPPDQKPDISGVKNEELPLEQVKNSGSLFLTHVRLALSNTTRIPGLMDSLKKEDESPVLVDDEDEPTGQPKVTQVVGTFKGIEEGDYYHWNMTTEKGEDLSLYIWEAGPDIDSLLKEADQHVDKKCRVYWTKQSRNIPEADGNTEVEELVRYEWIK